MFVTTHAAVGALIGEALPGHPILAFALGIILHFVSDMVPHGDSQLYKGYLAGSKVKRAIAYSVIDAVVAIFFVLFLFNTRMFDSRITVSMGIAGSILPDLIVAIYEVFKVRQLKWFQRLHFFFHNLITDRAGDLTTSSGFAMQMLFLAALITRIG